MIVEVCSYRVKASRRTDFIQLLEGRAIPEIRAQGTKVLGPLVDVENMNRVVWLRSYSSNEERGRLKQAFHQSAAWVEELGPVATPMLESWDFAVCETSSGYTQDELGNR